MGINTSDVTVTAVKDGMTTHGDVRSLRPSWSSLLLYTAVLR